LSWVAYLQRTIQAKVVREAIESRKQKKAKIGYCKVKVKLAIGCSDELSCHQLFPALPFSPTSLHPHSHYHSNTSHNQAQGHSETPAFRRTILAI
jgi:hypothetical protein